MPTQKPRVINLSEYQIRRFWSKVDVRFRKWCWPWKGKKNRSGYGVFVIGKGHDLTASRVAYWIEHRLDPGVLFVLHRCDNGLCCNPRHLFLGTAKDNTYDMVMKGRHPSHVHPDSQRGEKSGINKLTENDVRDIRKAFKEGEIRADIAERYNVTWTCINSLLKGKSWAHVS